jgi:hypothetical protein
MKRLIILTAVIGSSVVLVGGPAMAGQCPKLAAAIRSEAFKRFDGGAAEARAKVAQVEQLHKDGKHAESEQLAHELLQKLGKDTK